MKKETAADTYKSIAKEYTGIYKESGSRFLAYAFPVSGEEEIKNIIEKLKREHYSARHHCYAYRLGPGGDVWRANDDGEPSSTAGKPILGQILSRELSDILIVVVRYFGGVKLGVPGLIKAYKMATADALESAQIVEKICMTGYKADLAFEQLNSALRIIRDYNAVINRQVFDNNCTIEFSVRLRDAKKIEEEFIKNNILIYA